MDIGKPERVIEVAPLREFPLEQEIPVEPSDQPEPLPQKDAISPHEPDHLDRFVS